MRSRGWGVDRGLSLNPQPFPHSRRAPFTLQPGTPPSYAVKCPADSYEVEGMRCQGGRDGRRTEPTIPGASTPGRRCGLAASCSWAWGLMSRQERAAACYAIAGAGWSRAHQIAPLWPFYTPKSTVSRSWPRGRTAPHSPIRICRSSLRRWSPALQLPCARSPDPAFRLPYWRL